MLRDLGDSGDAGDGSVCLTSKSSFDDDDDCGYDSDGSCLSDDCLSFFSNNTPDSEEECDVEEWATRWAAQEYYPALYAADKKTKRRQSKHRQKNCDFHKTGARDSRKRKCTQEGCRNRAKNGYTCLRHRAKISRKAASFAKTSHLLPSFRETLRGSTEQNNAETAFSSEQESEQESKQYFTPMLESHFEAYACKDIGSDAVSRTYLRKCPVKTGVKSDITEGGNELIHVKIVDTRGDALPQYYNMRRKTRLGKIFEVYSRRRGIPMDSLRFIYRHRILQPLQLKNTYRVDGKSEVWENVVDTNMFESPAELGMEANDIISVSTLMCSLRSPNPMQLQDEIESKEDSISPDAVMILIIDSNTKLGQNYIMERDDSEAPKWLFEEYARKKKTQIKFVRFKYNGRALFLSSVKRKTATELGFQNGDEIQAWHMVESSEEWSERAKPKSAVKKGKSNNNTPKNRKKAKGKNGSSQQKPAYVEVDMEKKWKREHSRAISRVFEEAMQKFKEVRQKLDSLNLERTKPKSKRMRVKMGSAPHVEPVDNPPMEGLGGKAGKTHYPIQIGEVNNLYKSAKRSKRRKQKSRKKAKQNENISLDLHGMTADEARTKLDESLSKWIDIAMHGSYPFVIRVNVICGGGSQILSEVVETWIRMNDKVANAPKKGR